MRPLSTATLHPPSQLPYAVLSYEVGEKYMSYKGTLLYCPSALEGTSYQHGLTPYMCTVCFAYIKGIKKHTTTAYQGVYVWFSDGGCFFINSPKFSQPP